MKTVNTALLSFGMSGRVFHAPFIQLHSGFLLKGAWERSQKKIQSHYPGVISYESLDALLADEEVELVVVNTPTYTHFEYAKKVLEAGKHVVVEKAFVSTAEEAMILRDLAASKNLKLSVFQNRRWDSDFKTVQKVLQEGLIGDLKEARIAFDRFRPELSPKIHKEKPSPGAGIIKDLGAHVIDQALCLFGMPESVFADIAITREGSEVDDYFDILLSYPGKRVHVHGGYFFAKPFPEFALYGSKGSFLKSRSDVQEPQLDAGLKPDAENYGVEDELSRGLLTVSAENGFAEQVLETLKGDYMEYYDGVFNSIVSGTVEPVTAQDGVNVMRVIDAAFLSAEKGQVIKL